MNKNIVIIGGYGHVGQSIAKALAPQFASQLVIAGRDYNKAATFAKQLAPQTTALAVDVTKPADENLLNTTTLIIMCIDQHSTEFAKSCMARGIHYIDISANYDVLEPISKLQSAGTAVLSVGLAPGITNLLTKALAEQLGDVKNVDIAIMLGLGDSHGKAAIEWTLDGLTTPYMLRNTYIEPLTDGKKVQFGKLGTHSAYRFNFSDQHILSDNLQARVTTRFCVEIPIAMQAFLVSKRLGLLAALQQKYLRDLTVKALQKSYIGKEVFAVKIEASSLKERASALLIGEKEAEITALMAAEVAIKLMTETYPSGVFHIEQLFSWSDFPTIIKDVQFEQ